MIPQPRRIAVFVAAAALGACGGEEHGDLKQELAQLTKDVRGRVEPLPQVRPYEPVPYTAEGQIDPFRPERIDVAAAGTPRQRQQAGARSEPAEGGRSSRFRWNRSRCSARSPRTRRCSRWSRQAQTSTA